MEEKIGLACFQVCCLFLLTLLYGDLAETFTNVALDHSTRHFVLPITNREREVHERHRSIDMEQNITVEPPAEVKDWPLPIVYDVGWFKYVWMHNAKNLCIDMGDGAWGQPWYRIEASCR